MPITPLERTANNLQSDEENAPKEEDGEKLEFEALRPFSSATFVVGD